MDVVQNVFFINRLIFFITLINQSSVDNFFLKLFDVICYKLIAISQPHDRFIGVVLMESSPVVL